MSIWNLSTKKTSGTIAGVAFTIILFTVFEIFPEKKITLKHGGKASGLDRF